MSSSPICAAVYGEVALRSLISRTTHLPETRWEMSSPVTPETSRLMTESTTKSLGARTA